MRRMEHLNRGLVAVKTVDGVYLSWRFLGDEDDSISFEVFRNDEKIAEISDSTNYLDASGSNDSIYFVVPVNNGQKGEASEKITPFTDRYLEIKLDKPEGGVCGKGEHTNTYEYKPNDCSVADLDGDGEYEIIVKWDPTNSKDNAFNGYTANVLLDAYKLDGTKLWRIDLGQNIRAGAHYTQFMVYDFDGDGYAELVCKTADGTVDGVGNVIGDKNACWVSDDENIFGRILDGPEYLTVFDGKTGKALDTVPYEPTREGEWGDNYGNRCDRFLAAVAYLDGERPSAVMCRGYYTRTTLAAYNVENKKLKKLWLFDTAVNGFKEYEDKGNHHLSVGDVDNDGCDEIIYGACAIDHDGSPMYIVGCEFDGKKVNMSHGDAMHLGNFIPEREGKYEVFSINEATHDRNGNKIPGYNVHDAATGEVLFCGYTGIDTGRALACKIVPEHGGYQFWTGNSLYDVNGNVIAEMPSDMDHIEEITDAVLETGKAPEPYASQSTHGRYPNFAAYWDGDLLQEIVDKTWIDKYDYEKNELVNLLSADECTFINYTKSNPCLQADIFGDWREELVWPTKDGTALHIYTTTDVTKYKIRTLMHDPQYRLSIAWQNTCYNQPPHTSFYLDEDTDKYPLPKKRDDIDVSPIIKK